jgi:hypothetical protein
LQHVHGVFLFFSTNRAYHRAFLTLALEG